MSTASERPHLSIGEVLNNLREEFPDVTISKIRFLESQGLLDPERTPSGYRKFYEGDVERLRWILHQQREHFLPLKVIKGRLQQLELGDGMLSESAVDDTVIDLEAEAAAEPAPKARKATKSKSPAKKRGKVAHEAAASATASAPKPEPEPPIVLDDGRADDLASSSSGVSLTRAELTRAAGLDDAQLAQLEAYGLIAATQVGEHVLFDEEQLTIARLAAGFNKFGIDARHLRMYRNFAEREVGLYEQVLLPALRQRNPESRARAHEQLAELAKLGRGLRTVYLRQAAREVLGE